jgi:hypothetical protein
MRFHGRRAGLWAATLIALAACNGSTDASPDAGPLAKGVAGDVPAKAPGSQGRIACDAPEFEWGTVLAGQEVSHTFVVKNVGEGVLRILGARAGCSCTAAVVSASELPPGGEGRIEVKFNTKGRKGVTSKTVDVTTDSETNPKLTLTVKGTIEVLAAFENGYLDLGRVMMGTTKTQTVRIEAKDPVALRLSDLKVSNPAILKAEMVAGAAVPAVKVTFTAGDAPGNVSGNITVATNVPEVPALTLQVRASVGGDLDVRPSTAVLSPFEKGQPPPEFTMRVASMSARPFTLLKLEDPSGMLAGNVAPQGGGWLVRVIARKAPKTSSGIFYVLTDRKDQPRLAIPYVVSDPAVSIAKMRGPAQRSVAPKAAPPPPR